MAKLKYIGYTTDVVLESWQTCTYLHKITCDFAPQNHPHGRTVTDSL